MSNWTSWWSSGWKPTCQCRGHGFNFWSQEDSSFPEAIKPEPWLLMPKCLRAECSAEKGAATMRGPHTTREPPLLAATAESTHTAAKTQCSQEYTNLKGMKEEQYFDNQRCFLHVLGIRKTTVRKISFVDLRISYYSVNYRFTRTPALLWCIYNLTNFKTMILRLWWAPAALEGLIDTQTGSNSQKYWLSRYEVGLKDLHL